MPNRMLDLDPAEIKAEHHQDELWDTPTCAACPGDSDNLAQPWPCALWQLADQLERATTAPLRIVGTWLVSEVGKCTCNGPSCGVSAHEPGCGLDPEVDLSTLPGYAELLERTAKGKDEAKPARDWSALAPRAQEPARFALCLSCGAHPGRPHSVLCESRRGEWSSEHGPELERSLGSTFPAEELVRPAGRRRRLQELALAPSTLDRLQEQWTADLHAQVDRGVELATTCADCGYHHGAHAVGCPNRRTGP